MASYLIPYVRPEQLGGHEDPMFSEFTYGDEGNRGIILRNKVEKGDYLFFHTKYLGKRVISAYYVVETVIPTEEAQKDERIINKYKNPHLHKDELCPYDTIVFGNPIYSMILKYPFPVTPEILQKLSNPPKLNKNQTELAAISSALRNWKLLSEKDVQFLLSKIFEYEKNHIFLKDTFLSNQEIDQLDEADIESFINNNPHVLGSNFRAYKRQYVLKKSRKRIDLLFKDSKDNFIVIEIKKGAIGREAYKQIKEYIGELSKEFNDKHIRGILVCENVLPAFEEFYLKKIKEGEIDVFLYGWKFSLRPLINKD